MNTTLINFQSHSDFRESSLYFVYRESAWCRESLQRRKAFEKLLPVSSPPLRCTFVSLSPLTPSFSLSLPVIPVAAYEVTVFLLNSRAVWAHDFFFQPLMPIFHSGVTLFHSPTQGITSLKGTVVDLVGSCTETLQSSAVWVTRHAVLLVPKTDRSKYSVCLRASLLLCIRLKLSVLLLPYQCRWQEFAWVRLRYQNVNSSRHFPQNATQPQNIKM